MADEKSEEFKRFILENRELIEAILNEEKDDVKDEFKERVDETKGKAKDVSDAVFQIISDDDVQKHFMTACLEFLHFFEAVIKAAPLSPEMREAADKFKETKDTAVKNVVAVGAKDKMEKININDGGSKTSSKSKGKVENIKINTPKKSKDKE